MAAPFGRPFAPPVLAAGTKKPRHAGGAKGELYNAKRTAALEEQRTSPRTCTLPWRVLRLRTSVPRSTELTSVTTGVAGVTAAAMSGPASRSPRIRDQRIVAKMAPATVKRKMSFLVSGGRELRRAGGTRSSARGRRRGQVRTKLANRLISVPEHCSVQSAAAQVTGRSEPPAPPLLVLRNASEGHKAHSLSIKTQYACAGVTRVQRHA